MNKPFNSASAYLRKGNVLLSCQRYEEALAAYEHASLIDLDIIDPYFYQNKGHALSGLKRYEEALIALEQAIRLSLPYPDPRFYEEKGNILKKLAEQAYELATQYSRGKPMNWLHNIVEEIPMEQYLTKAEQLYKDQRYEEALAVYEEALRLSLPDPDPRIYYGRATVLEQLAERAYEMAKQGRKREDEQEKMNLQIMNLTDLARYSTEEIAKSRQNKAWNEQYPREILRRAALLQDSESWDVLQQLFSETVLIWLMAHSGRENALRFENADYYVAQTFERCWQAMRKSQVVFPSLAAFLKYLRISLNSVIADTLRASSKEFPALSEFDELAIETNNRENEIWEVIQEFITDQKEKRVAYLILYCGLKPREIMRCLPGEFKNAKDIYLLYHKILNRLTRNVEQIRWKLSSREP